MGNCVKAGRAPPDLAPPDEFDFERERAEASYDPRSRATQWLDRKRREMFCTKGMDLQLRLLGLDGAGKTTILYKLALGKTVETIPTIGFNVERVAYRGRCLDVWDVGGQDKIRPLWRHHTANLGNGGVVWVIDSSDKDRLGLSCNELHLYMAQEELRDAMLLVWANKQDLEPWPPFIRCRYALATCVELCLQLRADTGDTMLSCLIALPSGIRELIVQRAF